MNKCKMKKLAWKTGLDAIGIIACGLTAVAAPEVVPALKGSQIFLAVAAGVWVYVPLRNFIDKATEKYSKCEEK